VWTRARDLQIFTLAKLESFLRLWLVNLDYLHLLVALNWAVLMGTHHPHLVEETLTSNQLVNYPPNIGSNLPHWMWLKRHSLLGDQPYSKTSNGPSTHGISLCLHFDGKRSCLRWIQTRAPDWNTFFLLVFVDLGLVWHIDLLNFSLHLLMKFLDFFHTLGFWSIGRGTRSSGLKGSTP